MNGHGIIWTEEAKGELSQILRETTSAESLQPAFYELLRGLRTSPNEVGESRGGGLRFHYVEPLGVYYEVDQAAREVRIISVRAHPFPL